MPKIIQKILTLAVIFGSFIPTILLAETNSDLAFLSESDFENYEDKNSSIEIYDPLEKFNRKIYIFNDYLDLYFIQYVAISYRKGIPKVARNSIRNFLNNLSLPISSANSLLQGNVDNSLATFSNFLINSTVGVGGLFDIAGQKGIRYRSEDFGQTLGHYGVTSGAYLMVPIFGPSSTRDLGGFFVDNAISPVQLNLLKVGGKTNLIAPEYRLAVATTTGIDKRESLIETLDDIRTESFDPYATIRSAYLQKRATDAKF